MFGNSLDKKILKLIETEEKHDKKEVVSSLEVLKLLKQRFLLMQDIFKPLIERLSKEMIVTNIYFTMELDGFFSISISYIKNGIEETIVLSQVEPDELDLVVRNQDMQMDNFIANNKKIILDVFNNGLNDSFDIEKNLIPSTSGLLFLTTYNDHLKICNNYRDDINYLKMLLYFAPESLKTSSSYPLLKEKFKDKENVDKFLEHVKVYEKDIPYYLSRKK